MVSEQLDDFLPSWNLFNMCEILDLDVISVCEEGLTAEVVSNPACFNHKPLCSLTVFEL